MRIPEQSSDAYVNVEPRLFLKFGLFDSKFGPKGFWSSISERDDTFALFRSNLEWTLLGRGGPIVLFPGVPMST